MITIIAKSEVKVTVTRKWYATLRHPKMHPYTKFGIPTSKNIGDMHRTRSGTDGQTDERTPNIEYRASVYRDINKGPSVRNKGSV